jgi:acyl-coenzyme A synthetase/AMP-(fatty) acid ligase
MGNCPELVACLIAVSSTGAAILALNPSWRAAEVRRALDILPVSGVITGRAFPGPWDELSEHVSAQRVLEIGSPDIRERSRPALTGPSPDTSASPAYYVASSGSTGVPKIISRSHQIVVEGSDATAEALGVTSDYVFASVTPFYTAGGLSASLLLPLLSGATSVLLSAFTPSSFLAAIGEHEISAFIGSPAVFELLIRSGCDLGPLASLELCGSGGAPLDPETAEEIRRLGGVRIRQVYGASEAGITAVEPAGGGPAMLPVEGVTFRILDPQGRPLPPGEAGEVEIRRPGMAAGYASGENSAVFSDGVYRSGDLGCLDREGGLTLIGRVRPLINIGGVKIDSASVENAILTLPGASACRVSTVPGVGALEVVKAVVAVEEGRVVTRADVISHCRGLLAEYELPRVVELVSAPPLDLTGKLVLPWDRPDDEPTVEAAL